MSWSPVAPGKRTIADGAWNHKKGRGLPFGFSQARLCQRSRIKCGFIREQQKTFPITVLSRVIPSGAQVEVGASAFCAWAKKPEDTDKTRQREALEAKASEILIAYKQTYGYQRLSNELASLGRKGKVGIKPGGNQSAPLNGQAWLESTLSQAF